MLSVNLYSPEKELIEQVYPITVKLEMSVSIPAHSGEIILPYGKYENCSHIEILEDSQVIFVGIVDEDITIINSLGKFKKYIIRSKMALLLDNEVCPVLINKSTGDFLGRRYLTPLGIEYIGDVKCMNKTITAEKGMTIYDIMYEYCSNVNDCLPYVSAVGEFSFSGVNKDKKVIFSENNGISYSEITINQKRCSPISRVYMKLNSSGYLSHIDNVNALESNILRERYIDCTFESGTSPITADKMIDNSNKSAMVVTVSAVGNLTDYLGCTAVVEEENLLQEEFIISDVNYTYNSSKEITTLKLERKI